MVGYKYPRTFIIEERLEVATNLVHQRGMWTIEFLDEQNQVNRTLALPGERPVFPQGLAGIAHLFLGQSERFPLTLMELIYAEIGKILDTPPVRV